MNVLQKITKTEYLLVTMTVIFLAALTLLYTRASDVADGADYTITVTHREQEEVTPEAPSLININTATQTELETLNGIGPAIAQRIIEYREEHGAFQNIEELLNVKGIGEATLNKFRDHITVSPAPDDNNTVEDHAT